MKLRWELGDPESRMEAWWQLFDRVADPPVGAMPAFFIGSASLTERPSDGPRFKAYFGVAEAPTVDVQVFSGAAGRALFSLYAAREWTVRSQPGLRMVVLSSWL